MTSHPEEPAFFRELPPEIRKAIYTLLVIDEQPITEHVHKFAGPYPNLPPIAQVCKLLRQEVLQVYYSENIFILGAPGRSISREPTFFRPNEEPRDQPFGMPLEFSSIDGGDILDNFDFDSFLNEDRFYGPIVASDKYLRDKVLGNANFGAWTVSNWRNYLGEFAQDVRDVALSTEATYACLNSTVKTRCQLEVRVSYDKNRKVVAEQVTARRHFCVCGVLQIDKENPEANRSGWRPGSKSKKDGRRLLTILEEWAEGRDFYYDEARERLCCDCGKPQIARTPRGKRYLPSTGRLMVGHFR